MSFATTSTQCQVLVMGAPLDPIVSQMLVYAEVDSTLFVPSQFKLVFSGMPNEVLLPSGLQAATPVSVTVSVDGVPVPLVTGEVVAHEVEHNLGETLTTVRGMDRSHRLMRGTNTVAFPEMTASDVVTMLLGEAGVVPGEIIPTTNVYEWLTQANVSDWVFIQQLAALENYLAYSDALGLFNFCPRPAPGEGEPPALTYSVPPTGTQLVLGRNLLRVRAVITAAEQVPMVTATGYDPTLAAPVLSPFPSVPSGSFNLDPGADPAVVAGEFEAAPFFDASRPFSAEGPALSWAKTVASDIAGSMAELEGECIGNPSILAGESITLGMAGDPFDGYYLCSAARHVFDPSGPGYTTWVTVGGFRDRSLYALASGAAPNDPIRPTIGGLVVGTVVDNEDPEDGGRVKVMFPWLEAGYVSAWCRVMQIGASKAGGGFLWMPEVDDEVLVGFDRGSIDHPFVIGNLYNGVSRPLPPPSIDGLVANRRIASRMAHTIQWNDGPSALGISITTAPAEASPASIVLDADQSKITVNSLGEVEITAVAGIKIAAAGGPISINGTDITIGGEDTLSLSIGGATISVGSPSTGTVSVSGGMITLGGE